MGVKHLFWTLALQVFPLSLHLMPLVEGKEDRIIITYWGFLGGHRQVLLYS